jgi:hypothetical protein
VFNFPVGLLALYLSFYSVVGLWDPDIPTILWLWAALQAPTAVIFCMFSATKYAAGATRTANRLLWMPFANLFAWIVAMQLLRLVS